MRNTSRSRREVKAGGQGTKRSASPAEGSSRMRVEPTLESQQSKGGMASKSYVLVSPAVVRGLWREPRLIKTWEDIQAGRSVGDFLTSQETFFHCCFAVMFGFARVTFQNGGDLWHFTKRFLSVWSLLASSADYATRYNDFDLFHKIFWTGYGICLVGVLMHQDGDANYPGFSFCAAACFCWLSVGYIRVAAHLRQCRVFSLFYALGSLAIAMCWLLNARHTEGYVAELMQSASFFKVVPILVLRWTTRVAHQILTIAFVCLVPRKYDIPMNIEYHRKKFSGIMVMCMGQMIAAFAIDPSTQSDSPYNVYLIGAFCFVILSSLEVLVYASDQVDTSQHAIRRSRKTALLWLLLFQPLLCFSINMVAASIGSTMTALHAGSDQLSSACRMLCCSNGTMHLLFFLLRLLHGVRAKGSHHQDFWLRHRFTLEKGILVASAFIQFFVAYTNFLTHWPLQLIGALAIIGGVLVVLEMLRQLLSTQISAAENQ